MVKIRIGIAGWSIPKQYAAEFPADGTHLARYAARFSGVEINSSFYRPHRHATYARWAASVPADFRFAAKLPRDITHRRKLVDTTDLLDRFFAEVAGLGGKLGPLLAQLPPSLAYTESVATGFFAAVRARCDGDLVCEPRHQSWFTDAADGLLTRFRVARVAADPAPVPRAAIPAGWGGVVYRRLHGSPRMYYSAYDDAALDALAAVMRASPAQVRETWCIFDNTALGEAFRNGLALQERLGIDRQNAPILTLTELP